jgi:KUP system potassium uptake protein
VMYTWRSGTRVLSEKTRRHELPLVDLVDRLEKNPPPRVPGTAVFLTADPHSAPTALLHSLKHFKVLHQRNVILTIENLPVPHAPSDERFQIDAISATFSRVILRFGFMETPNVPKALMVIRSQGWQFDIMSTSFFLSRRMLRPAETSRMPRWQDHLFIALARMSNDATEYFHLPSGRVVEVGMQIKI